MNIAYANLLGEMGGGSPYVGAQMTVEAAVRMGIRCCPRTTEPSGPLAAVPSAVLGVNEVSTLEMASAFGTLAFAGQHVQPTPVVSITTRDGEVIYRSNARPTQSVEPAIAQEAVDILKGVVSGGTGTAANIGRPQFGKTGTAQNASDAWFVGAIPQIATAVWVGFPAGSDPHVLRQRPDLDRLRRHVAGADLAGLHVRGHRPDAGEGVRDRARGGVRHACGST